MPQTVNNTIPSSSFPAYTRLEVKNFGPFY